VQRLTLPRIGGIVKKALVIAWISDIYHAYKEGAASHDVGGGVLDAVSTAMVGVPISGALAGAQLVPRTYDVLVKARIMPGTFSFPAAMSYGFGR
jgi:hypothetical protein